MMPWSLLDLHGRRKYLVPRERAKFIRAAVRIGGPTGTFCAVLAFCGARISEVLALTPERLDEGNSAIVFETLKRRERGIYRAVPVPRQLLDCLDKAIDYRSAQLDPLRSKERLWPWCRTTAWKRVKFVMRAANQPAYLSKPKALRHAFGIKAVNDRIALSLIKKWLGHAKIETTEIYTTPIGQEERALAKLTWNGLLDVF